MARARMVARSNAPVLLFGETGTGKEIIARAIHEHSPFRHGPVPPRQLRRDRAELIDSELFGHEPGAFTGATSRRKGWFEQADGGTLFLDEVGELAPAAQVRLLRVVQDGEVVRVGGERPIRVTVASSPRPTAICRDGRSAGVPRGPLLPPVRLSDRHSAAARPSRDVRAFAEYFAERAANRFGLRRGAGLRR
jgi:hydrogenase-4 transcriptional activator